MANIMSKRGTQDNVITYEHYCDTKADLANIPKDQITLGSTAVVLQDEDGSLGVYIAGSDKQWIAVAMSGGSDSGSGEGSSSSDGLKDFLENNFSTFENSDVTKLRYNAFAMNKQLEEISLPNCSIINGGAFANCTALTSVDFPTLERIEGPEITQQESLIWDYYTSTSSIVMVTVKGPGAFQGCTSIESIDLPLCSYIGSDAFLNYGPGQYGYGYLSNPNLKSVNLPECKTIENRAFYMCTGLNSLNAPKVETIGESAFTSCTSLTIADFPLATSVASNAFCSCYLLSTINMPNLEVIGVSAFTLDSSITTINFPKCKTFEMMASSAYLGSSYNMYIGHAFGGCSNLSTVSLPECEVIAPATFSNCSSITELSFPKVSLVYSNAFRGCTSLTQITFNETVTFSTAWSMYVNVGPTVDVTFETFYNCTNLQSIYLLGSSVCTFNINDPQYSYKINAGTLFGNTPIRNSSYLGYYGSIYVPESLVEEYQNAPGWSAFSERITAYTGE